MAKSKSKEQSPTDYSDRALSQKQMKQLVKLGYTIQNVQDKLELIDKIEEIEDKIMDLTEMYR
tara:strand:+ start:744 stop:932 length:189 start_codon:yes stop_codon:yes gene_type:complete